jgi:sortase B
MLKSVRLWVAVLLVLSSFGYTAFRKQSLSHLPSEKHVSQGISAIQTEPYKQIYQEDITLTVTETLKESEISPVTTETDFIQTEFFNQPETLGTAEEDASVPCLSEQKISEITERFKIASNYSESLIGWIYLANSEIDYPVVQGNDNQYYLHHAPDGTPNELGTIFLDYHCSYDFSDKQNILFGHNMDYGMFGDIRSFKDRDNFEKHRYGWLFTKDYLYRIDFFALVIVSAYDSVYDIPADNTAWLTAMEENSLYLTETELSEEDCFIALSTCASDFEDARALFTGKLVPVREFP